MSTKNKKFSSYCAVISSSWVNGSLAVTQSHSCSVRTLRLGKSSGTLWNFITDMELYGTIRILHFAGQSVVVVDSSACSTNHVPAVAHSSILQCLCTWLHTQSQGPLRQAQWSWEGRDVQIVLRPAAAYIHNWPIQTNFRLELLTKTRQTVSCVRAYHLPMFYAIVTSDNDFFRECYGTFRLGEKFRNFMELFNVSYGMEQLCPVP